MLCPNFRYTLLGFDIRFTHTHTLSLSLSSEMARIQAVVWVWVLAALLLSPCSAGRELRGDLHGRRSSPSVRRSLNSGDDSGSSAVKVADYQSQYNEWVRFQTEALNDYPPAAANPGGPYTTP